MSRLDPSVWSRLRPIRLAGEQLLARLALPELTDRLLCALDAKGKRHLLIALALDDDEFLDSQSRGLSVVTRNLEIPGSAARRYIDIECREIVGYSALDTIAGEIADELVQSNGTPAQIVRRALVRWRRFWSNPPLHLLTREEQLGLFGELWFLANWLLPRIGAAAVSSWKGPHRLPHDFELPDRSVEAKATTSTRSRIHRIHGLKQLEAHNNRPLYLFSLRLREDDQSATHVPEMVEACRRQLVTDSDALGRFESLLAETGYSSTHFAQYATFCLHVVDEIVYAVADDFPRLTASSFAGDGPTSGITRVEYEIDLGGFQHLVVARQAQEWQY